MKLRLQVVILTMALLVAGAGSAFANPLDPHVEPVVPGPGSPGCTVEAAPAPVAPPNPGEPDEYNLATIPLDKVCPPLPPGQSWYDSATPVGRIRVGHPRHAGSVGTALYRVYVPVKIELDEPGMAGPTWSLAEPNTIDPELHPLLGDRYFRLTSESFYRPGTALQLTFHSAVGHSENVYNPRIGQVSSRSIIGGTNAGAPILLPQVTVSIDLTVPRP